MWNLRDRLRRRIAPTVATVAVAGLFVTGVLATTAVPTAAAQTRSAATVRCNISRVWHNLGPTYVERLTVVRTTCANGKTTIRDYNRCRLRAGGVKGRCASRVNGFSCRERRYASPIQFEAVVACTNRRSAVNFSYSEDT